MDCLGHLSECESQRERHVWSAPVCLGAEAKGLRVYKGNARPLQYQAWPVLCVYKMVSLSPHSGSQCHGCGVVRQEAQLLCPWNRY